MWLPTFLRVHSNSKKVSYLSWRNTYPNLKATCHIKLKFFVWTKLLENLLLPKYLISVTAAWKNTFKSRYDQVGAATVRFYERMSFQKIELIRDFKFFFCFLLCLFNFSFIMEERGIKNKRERDTKGKYKAYSVAHYCCL